MSSAIPSSQSGNAAVEVDETTAAGPHLQADDGRLARIHSVQQRPTSNSQGTSAGVGCNGCPLPSFQLPWTSSVLQQSISSTSSFSLFNQEMAVQRLREATQRNNNARLVWFALHAVFIVFVLIVDSDLYRAIKNGQHWYYGSYFLAVAVTIGQYLYTAGSSPGYVQEIMAQLEEQDVETMAAGRPLRIPPVVPRPSSGMSRAPSTPDASAHSSAASPSSGSAARTPTPVAVFSFAAERTPLLATSTPPPTAPAYSDGGSTPSLLAPSAAPVPAGGGSRLSFFPRARPPFGVSRFVRSDSLQLLRRTDSNRRCPYCNVWQPMRSKHCHDCDKCVLRFDHHCFWVGTCVGQRNHCRFWWYLLYESTLTLWTLWICITAFKWEDTPEGWMEHNVFLVIACISLVGLFTFLASLVSFHTWLVLTNQTTYETTRRKRIPYLRNIPDEVYPFSNGFIANVSQFCCTPSTAYPLYTIPTLAELTARADNRTWLRNEYYSCY